jgi:hypothetical protein
MENEPMATITMDHFCKNGDHTKGAIGDGCTLLLYSDTYPATIVKRTPKTLTVQVDQETIVGGKWPDLEYTYAPNPKGDITTYFWSDKHGWVNNKATARRCLVGERRYYRDPTF